MSQAKSCLIIDDDPDDQEIFLMCAKKLNRNIDFKTIDNGSAAISLLISDAEILPDTFFLM
jgi:hypothetical protein